MNKTEYLPPGDYDYGCGQRIVEKNSNGGFKMGAIEVETMVAGFLFSPEKDKVVLIEKNHPEWQKGRLNGIGGHVKKEENLTEAMIREFKEEAGVEIKDWKAFAIMHGDRKRVPELKSSIYFWEVSFFYAIGPLDKVRSMTDEQIVIVDLESLYKFKLIWNLHWLIPLALDERIQKPVSLINN
jgi:8-oxo-dGTP diphosphatase